MPARVGLFSTGVPDPSQGGSGIFNHLLARHLLAGGHEVRAFFRAGDWFLRDHANLAFLAELERDGLEHELVPERSDPGEYGLPLLLANHHLAACRDVVERRRGELERLDGAVSLDLGWAVALAAVDIPTVAVLGDPLHRRWRADFAPRWRERFTWKRLAQLQSLMLARRPLRRMLAPYDGDRRVLGSFAAHHAREYARWGLACRHFRWFTLGPERVRHSPSAGVLRALHVGSLHTTASGRMVRYLAGEVYPELARLPFEVEVRFVGKAGAAEREALSDSGVRTVFAGHVDNLEDEFEAADVYLSPMRYPVGVRTRILTALAHGVPVIADGSAAAATPELADGRDVLYASTPAAIGAALTRLHAGGSTLRAELAANARSAWERNYDPAVNIPDLLAPLRL